MTKIAEIAGSVRLLDDELLYDVAMAGVYMYGVDAALPECQLEYRVVAGGLPEYRLAE